MCTCSDRCLISVQDVYFVKWCWWSSRSSSCTGLTCRRFTLINSVQQLQRVLTIYTRTALLRAGSRNGFSGENHAELLVVTISAAAAVLLQASWHVLAVYAHCLFYHNSHGPRTITSGALDLLSILATEEPAQSTLARFSESLRQFK